MGIDERTRFCGSAVALNGFSAGFVNSHDYDAEEATPSEVLGVSYGNIPTVTSQRCACCVFRFTLTMSSSEGSAGCMSTRPLPPSFAENSLQARAKGRDCVQASNVVSHMHHCQTYARTGLDAGETFCLFACLFANCRFNPSG